MDEFLEQSNSYISVWLIESRVIRIDEQMIDNENEKYVYDYVIWFLGLDGMCAGFVEVSCEGRNVMISIWSCLVG